MTYITWLHERIAEIRRERRRAQWRRYSASEKGRARSARYDDTPKGRARKLLYEHTIRAAMRAPNPYGNGFMAWHPRGEGWMGPGAVVVDCTREKFPLISTTPFDIRARYAEQIRRERAAGILSPLTLAELA